MSEIPKWFQKLFYKESVLAIKSSLDFLSYENFKNDLIHLLPQESKKSKARIASNILHRFFPDKKIYSFLPQVWQAYQDEMLLQEIIRYELLSKEPVISDFILNHILTKKVNEKISSELFANYIKDIYRKESQNLTWWLQGAVRDLGFISKSDNLWKINDIRLPETAFILLLHKIFAQHPREIDLNEVLENNFWKLIGIRDEKIMKSILLKADLIGLIDFKKNIIQTKHSLENLLAQKLSF